MKKLLLILSSCILILVLFLLMSPRFGAKREALGTVGNALVNSKYHQAVIVEGGSRIFGAQYNLDTIARSTEYMGIFGSGTLVFREIARIASEGEKDCVLLDRVLDLAARSTSDSQRILALAESACRVEGTSDEAAWFAAYDDMVTRAEYSSVSAAIASRAGK